MVIFYLSRWFKFGSSEELICSFYIVGSVVALFTCFPLFSFVLADFFFHLNDNGRKQQTSIRSSLNKTLAACSYF